MKDLVMSKRRREGDQFALAKEFPTSPLPVNRKLGVDSGWVVMEIRGHVHRTARLLADGHGYTWVRVNSPPTRSGIKK